MRGSVVVVGLFVCFTMKEYVYIVRCFYIFQRCRSLNPEEKGLKGLFKFSGKKKRLQKTGKVALFRARKVAGNVGHTLEGRMDMTFSQGTDQ